MRHYYRMFILDKYMKSLYYKFAALPMFFLLAVGFTASAQAEETVSQTLNLEAGWNIVSTPMVLESHDFSADETSDNFDIYVLDAPKSTGWATMADLGQTEFTPLYGYFINNKTGEDQTLTFNYDTTLEPNEKLFARSFTAEGWYSIGVANAEYAKRQADDRVDTNNPSQILNLLAGKYDMVVDFTDEAYDENRKSVAVEGDWKAAVAADINNLNDLRDTKGYAIYIKESAASYSGFQNDPVNETIAPTELAFSLSPSNPDAYDIVVDKYNVTTNQEILEYQIEAKNGDVAFDELLVNLETSTKSLGEVIEKASMLVDGELFAEGEINDDSTIADFIFTNDTAVIIPEGEMVTVEILVDLKAQEGNYATGETIQAKVTEVLVDDTVAADIDGILEAEQLTGSAIGDVHRLVSKGIMIPVDGFSSTVDTLGTNDTTGEFTLEFEVSAVDDDYYITDNVSNTATENGVKYSVEGGDVITTASLTSTADEDTSGVFTVREGETETFTLVVTVDPATTGTFRVELNEVWYSANVDGVTNAEAYLPTPAQDFRTSSKSINN